MNGKSYNATISHCPSGAGSSLYLAFPGLRFASPGLFSTRPSGTTEERRPDEAGSFLDFAFPGLRFAYPWAIFDASLRDDGGTQTLWGRENGPALKAETSMRLRCCSLQGNRMNGKSCNTTISHCPSGAGSSLYLAFPGLRFAGPGLFSTRPSGTTKQCRPDEAGSFLDFAFPGLRFACPWAIFDASLRDDGATQTL